MLAIIYSRVIAAHGSFLCKSSPFNKELIRSSGAFDLYLGECQGRISAETSTILTV